MQYLDVRGNRMGAAGVNVMVPALKEMTGLTHFAINGNKMGPEGAAALVHGAPKARFLGLSAQDQKVLAHACRKGRKLLGR